MFELPVLILYWRTIKRIKTCEYESYYYTHNMFHLKNTTNKSDMYVQVKIHFIELDVILER